MAAGAAGGGPGLPVEPPGDRHRWFFGRDEAAAFLAERGGRGGFAVEQVDSEDAGPCPPWRTRDGRNLVDNAACRAGTLWCLLRRARSRRASPQAALCPHTGPVWPGRRG